jgi:PPM family protein phosphatase
VSPETFRIDSAGLSDRGLVRITNQDVARVVPALRLAIVADGIGGLPHGEVASKLATEVFEQTFARLGGIAEAIDETRRRVLSAFTSANERMASRQPHDPSQDSGRAPVMGTTLVTAVITPSHVVIAHVGDSRCYRLRGEELVLLTHDHSFAAELRGLEDDGVSLSPEITARWEHVLTRSVHGAPGLEIDSFTVTVERGDQFLLCSDGLWGSVAAARIASILRDATDASDACRRLVSAAWAAGGLDNIGVAVMRLC